MRWMIAAGWLILAMLVGLTTGLSVASAQPTIGHGRWCVTLPLGGMMQCSYRSLDECMFFARGVSNQCSLNPWYEGPPEPQRRKGKPRT